MKTQTKKFADAHSRAMSISRRGRGAVGTIRNEGNRVNRNDLCPCGNGRKFKQCGMVLASDEERERHADAVAAESKRQGEELLKKYPALTEHLRRKMKLL
jgi:hypothetical protein